jgi:hypothetical protein
MDASTVVPIITGVFGVVTAGIAVSAVNWASVRPQARHLWVVDLATKRLAFWEQFLKVAAVATDPDSDKYKTAREQAYDAILNISDHATRDLKGLSWGERTTQLVKNERSQYKRLLVFKPDPSLNTSDKVDWYARVFASWFTLMTVVFLFVIFMLFLVSHPHPTAKQDLLIILLQIFIYAFSYVAGQLRFNADKLKYPPPERPILDRI